MDRIVLQAKAGTRKPEYPTVGILQSGWAVAYDENDEPLKSYPQHEVKHIDYDIEVSE